MWVQPYPGPGPGCRVTRTGGRNAQWTVDSQQLFVQGRPPGEVSLGPDESGVSLTAVIRFEIVDGDFCDSEPTLVFEGVLGSRWAVSPDGDFLVTLEPVPEPRMILVEDFLGHVKSLLPN